MVPPMSATPPSRPTVLLSSRPPSTGSLLILSSEDANFTYNINIELDTQVPVFSNEVC